VTWTSRVIYAFARDEGMPASAVWKRVSAVHQTPAPAIWLSIAVAFVATISSGTYAVVTSISVIGLYVSYIVPVFLAWRVRGTTGAVAPGPWHLGRYGAAINVIAMLWVAFITVILVIPDDMRAGKAIAGVAVVLGLWYWVAERQRFRGPRFSKG
jgi:amino acid transporter